MRFYNCSFCIPHKGEENKRFDIVEGLARCFDNHEVQIDKDIRQLKTNAALNGFGVNSGGTGSADVLSELEKSVMKLESSKADKVRTNMDHYFVASPAISTIASSATSHILLFHHR
jgi:hypothetical protein